MSTRIFFLNSNTTLYGEEELNAIAKLFINQGVLNTLQDNNDDWVSNGDLKVLENSDGADMTVEVNTGWAIIETTRNTKTFKTFAQVINSLKLPISANDTGNDRVDTVIARVSRTVESNILANNVFTIEVITGTSGTALTDEEILAEIDGDDFLRLADITVGDGVTEIETADITDTRVMAETNQGLKHSPKVIFMGALANDPVNLDEGMLWYNETTHTLNFFNGNSTIQLGGAAGGYNPLKPSAQAEPNMTVAVASGNVRFGDTNLNFAGGNSPSFTAPTTPGDNRIDLLCLDYNGTLSIIQGTATSGTPVVPDYPVGKFVVCEVFLRNGATSIKDTDDTTNGYIYNDARGFSVETIANYEKTMTLFGSGNSENVVTVLCAGDFLKGDPAFIINRYTIPTEQNRLKITPIKRMKDGDILAYSSSDFEPDMSYGNFATCVAIKRIGNIDYILISSLAFNSSGKLRVFKFDNGVSTVTTPTISGTAPATNDHQMIYGDGEYFYICKYASPVTTFRKYSFNGTTLTYIADYSPTRTFSTTEMSNNSLLNSGGGQTQYNLSAVNTPKKISMPSWTTTTSSHILPANITKTLNHTTTSFGSILKSDMTGFLVTIFPFIVGSNITVVIKKIKDFF